MQYYSVVVVAALAALGSTQSAPDFPIDVTSSLRVNYENGPTLGNNPGVMLTREGKTLSHRQPASL